MQVGELRTLMWFENDDSESGAILQWQTVSLLGDASPIDDYTQGNSSLASIGPLYTAPGTTPPSRPPAPLPITTGSIPWWWLAAVSYSPPPKVDPLSGVKPFYY